MALSKTDIKKLIGNSLIDFYNIALDEIINNNYLIFNVKNKDLLLKIISVTDYIEIDFGQGKKRKINVQPNVITEINHKYFGELTERTVKILNSNDIVYLDISNQGIQNIYCKNLKNLNKLLIYNNSITKCDFSNCNNLQYLHMFNNPICLLSDALGSAMKSLCDRNEKAFGSIILFSWSGFSSPSQNITMIRRSMEQIIIPKDWYFGSGIMYDETARLKIPKHILTSGAIDIWESAEYGYGITIGTYDREINNISSEWTSDIFNYRLCGGDVDDTLKTWVNASDIPSGTTFLNYTTPKNSVHSTTTESHGYKTLSTIFSQGNGIYGIAPNAKANYIFLNNTSTDSNTSVSRHVDVLEKLLNDSDLAYCCIAYNSDEDKKNYWKQKLDPIILDKDKMIFMAPGNEGDGNLTTDEVKYGQNFCDNATVINGLTSSGKSICWKGSQNDSVDYAVGGYTLTTMCSQTVYKNTNGTSFTAPIAAGMAALLINLYKKKNGRKPTRSELINELNKRTLPLFDYSSNEVGKGALNLMEYNNLYENEIAVTSFSVSIPSTVTQFERFKPTINTSPDNASCIDYKIYCESNHYAIAKIGDYLYPLKSGTFNVRFYLRNSNLHKDVSITVNANNNKKYDIKNRQSLIGEYRYTDLKTGLNEWKNKVSSNIDLKINTSVMTFGQNKLSCPSSSVKSNGIEFSDLQLKDFTLNLHADFNNFETTLTSPQYLFGFKQGVEGYYIGLMYSQNGTPLVSYNFTSIAFLNMSNYDTGISTVKQNISGNIINNPDYGDVLYNGKDAVMTIRYKHSDKTLEIYINGVLISIGTYYADDNFVTAMSLFYKVTNLNLYDLQLYDSYLSDKEMMDSCLYLLSKTSNDQDLSDYTTSSQVENKIDEQINKLDIEVDHYSRKLYVKKPDNSTSVGIDFNDIIFITPQSNDDLIDNFFQCERGFFYIEGNGTTVYSSSGEFVLSGLYDVVYDSSNDYFNVTSYNNCCSFILNTDCSIYGDITISEQLLDVLSYKYASYNHTHKYAGSNSVGGTATEAAKTTGTLTIQGNGTNINTFNGSTNKTVNITPANIGAATSAHTHSDYASSIHTHGLLNSDFTAEIENTTDDYGWNMVDEEYTGSEFMLKSLRMAQYAPSWLLGNYASGIMFGGSDTKGVMSVAYSSPAIKFAGGNDQTAVWNMQIRGSSDTIYNLDNFATTSDIGNINAILDEINGTSL